METLLSKNNKQLTILVVRYHHHGSIHVYGIQTNILILYNDIKALHYMYIHIIHGSYYI